MAFSPGQQGPKANIEEKKEKREARTKRKRTQIDTIAMVPSAFLPKSSFKLLINALEI